ncbi:hypothetical protein JOM56_015173 [Amanita muscaria]
MTVEAAKMSVSSKYSSFWYNCDWYMAQRQLRIPALIPEFSPLCIDDYAPRQWYIYSVFTWAAEALVGINVWAVWQKDQRLTISMPPTFAVLSVVSFVYMGIWLDSFELANPSSPLVHGCIVTSTSDNVNKPIIMVMIWISHDTASRDVHSSIDKSGSNSTFIKMVYNRGILYYVYLFGLHLASLLLLYYGPSADLFQTITLPSRILQMAVTTRLVLHTRQEASKHVVLFSDSTNEEIRFGVNWSGGNPAARRALLFS